MGITALDISQIADAVIQEDESLDRSKQEVKDESPPQM